MEKEKLIIEVEKELEEIHFVFGGFYSFRRFELEAQLRILKRITDKRGDYES